MKHTSLILFLLFICSGSLVHAQIKKEKKNKHKYYQESITLDIDQSDIAFNFVWFDDYQYGIGGYQDKYKTSGRIRSNVDWKLTCKAEGRFKHSSSNKKIGLNNVGYTVEYLGKNAVTNKIYYNTRALSKKNTTLMFSSNQYYYKSKKKKWRDDDDDDEDDDDEDDDDKNDDDDDDDDYNNIFVDDFVIYWEMGTQNGNMKKKSIYQQKLRRGSYSLNIKLSVSENL